MADYVEKYADKAAEELSKKIAAVYTQAAVDVRQKLNSFIVGHKAKAARMLQQVEQGEITEQAYKQWLKGQVFTGKLWAQKLKDVTDIYVNADEKARSIVGRRSLDVFAEAANYTAWQITKDFKGAVAFNLYDSKTVERLLKDNPKMLPEWNIDEPKDYIWNERRVRNAVTQGIIQGESVQDIGKRLVKDLSTTNASKMDMFARTAVTGAQNKGRIERMREADEKYGIKTQKRWLSVGDDRVRDTHEALDGLTVDYDEPFVVPNDGREIDCPGDPMADADLSYNCRCTLLYIHPNMSGDYSLESHHLKEYDTYNKWKAEVSGG